MATHRSLRSSLRHLCLQAVSPRAPSIRITAAAKVELQRAMARITEFEPVACLLWLSRVSQEQGVEEPRWGVGFYDLGTRSFGRVVKVDDVPFIFVHRIASERLNGATLDHRAEHFVVDEQPL